jgi:hypothetical protein
MQMREGGGVDRFKLMAEEFPKEVVVSIPLPRDVERDQQEVRVLELGGPRRGPHRQ